MKICLNIVLKYEYLSKYTFHFSTGALRIADEDIIHTVIDFLSYLKLKGTLCLS